MQRGGRVRRTGVSNITNEQRRRRRLWSAAGVALLAVLLLIVVISITRGLSRRTGITVTSLPCTADEELTPFGTELLYYDGSSLYCITPAGSVRWHETVGPARSFAASSDYVVVWYGKEVTVIGHNGIATYKDTMDDDVQFARVGSRYFAVVTGEDTAATLMIRALDGTAVDIETENYASKVLLDVGFYGDADQYVWSLALDVFGTAINTTMHTFQVGKMNTGIVDLGEYLAYRVLYEANRLRVFTTQQMYTYDYKAVQDVSATQLVFGWQLLNWYQPDRGGAYMLLAPTSQISASMGKNVISELRVLQDNNDRRYHVPRACVGAAVYGGNLYAVTSDSLYVMSLGGSQWRTYPLPMAEGARVTGLLCLTTDGRAIISSDLQVYALTLPE